MLPDNIKRLKEIYNNRLEIGDGCTIDPSVSIKISRDASLTIGKGTSIMRGTTLEVLKGGTLAIGPNVNIGENVFIAAMSRIEIAEGSALSNMVDMHDHNHRDRTFSAYNISENGEDVNTTGFEYAPIVLEPFVTISNKVTVTAGVRIGQNTKVGANAVVTRSLPPNCVAVGAPAKPLRFFVGPLRIINNPARLRIGFFGTSIMQHLEAYAPQIFDQMNLPQIGEKVEITEWRTRGYVQALSLMLQARWPYVSFEVNNHGYGGANTRKLLEVIGKRLEADARRYDLIFFSGGINDVWRRIQGRLDEAVNIHEYQVNYRNALTQLTRVARQVICLSETPTGGDDSAEMNAELIQYNAVAKRVADEFGLTTLDVWNPFLAAAESRRMVGAPSLWSDGVHLSGDGDATLLAIVGDAILEQRIIERLLTQELVVRGNTAVSQPSQSS